MERKYPSGIIRLALVTLVLAVFACRLTIPNVSAMETAPVPGAGDNWVAAADTAPPPDDDFDFMEEEYGTEVTPVSDPLEPWNRAMFQVNDRLYFWVLKPVATAYGSVIPRSARKGVKNFFENVKAPIRIVNCLLQAKGRAAMGEISGFVINSTAGFLGIMDPAEKYPGLNPGEEDLGQTLGRYGLGNGIYLVWPLFGPSTLRDTAGLVGDTVFLDPVSYIEPMELRLGINAEDRINSTSLVLGDYESFKNAAIEPYESFRNAYIQHRNGLVKE